ncbi:hypothetical protein GGX14DRAFT_364648, partial [Mycena pura]
QTFSSLNEKSAELATLSPRPQDALRELQELRGQICEEKKKMEKDIQTFKRKARNDVKETISASLKDDILGYVRQAITAQVEEQVTLQIQEHIPISLKEQSTANKTQLQEARTSLTNSAARKKNASLRIQNLDDGLAPVLKADGKLFPADLRSLLSYSADNVRDLVRDYGLPEDEVQEVNVNRFLAHTGELGIINFRRLMGWIPGILFQLVNAEPESIAVVHQAYRKFTHSELILFLVVRNLPTTGSDADLAARLAHHDLHIYDFSQHTLAPSSANGTPLAGPSRSPPKQPHVGPDLPVEILADIMDHVGDWELARAVGVPTSLTRPSAWSRASPTDEAMITGHLPLIRAVDPIKHPPSLGAELAIRFGYVNVLEYLLLESARMADGSVFKSLYKNDLIPIKASLHGRLQVLSWWNHGMEHHPDLIPAPSPVSISQALHNASSHGKVEVLDWWLNSGLQPLFQQDALIIATRHNRSEVVLEWWDKSRLPLQYRLCDVEEALEDAIGGGEAAREWWRRKGVDFNANVNDNEWMKVQNLN